jgi:small subunit ribosomal protein S21
MAFVKIGENENLERALKRFKKKVDDEGILKEYKDRQYFRKPSVIKREKKKEAIRKTQLKQRQDEKNFSKGR